MDQADERSTGKTKQWQPHEVEYSEFLQAQQMHRDEKVFSCFTDA
jgi:hypothetical protein